MDNATHLLILFDGGAGQPVEHDAIYTAYEYKASYGKMSLRMSWDGLTRTPVRTQFTYRRAREYRKPGTQTEVHHPQAIRKDYTIC